jgi:hypothetical protein
MATVNGRSATGNRGGANFAADSETRTVTRGKPFHGLKSMATVNGSLRDRESRGGELRCRLGDTEHDGLESFSMG